MRNGRTALWVSTAAVTWVCWVLAAAETPSTRSTRVEFARFNQAAAPANINQPLSWRFWPALLNECRGVWEDGVRMMRLLPHSSAETIYAQWADFLRRRLRTPRGAARWYARAIAKLERRTPGDGFGAALRDAYSGLARALAATNQPAAAFTAIERGRGRALLRLAEGGHERLQTLAERVARAGGPAVRRQVAALGERETRSRHQARVIQGRLEALDGSTTFPEIERRLRRTSLGRRLARCEDEATWARWRLHALVQEHRRPGPRPLDAEAAQARVPRGEVLLVYDVGPDDTLLLCIPHAGGAIEAMFLAWPDGQSVNEASLRAAMDAAQRDRFAPRPEDREEVQISARLFEALIPADLRPGLAAARRILIIPDGPLHELAFAALVLQTSGREGHALRWVDAWPPIVQGHSCTLLLRRTSRGPRPSGRQAPLAVTLGDVPFGRGRAGSSTASKDLSGGRGGWRRGQSADSRPDETADLHRPPLPATRMEIEAITGVMRRAVAGADVRVLAGAQATAGRLFAEADAPRFLHVATHGAASPAGAQHPLPAGALGLAVPVVPRTAFNDCGLLTAHQLLRDWPGRLAGTELVTLSSCRSAAGLACADKALPLAWGFLAAGAQSVLATLWDIEDLATAILMEHYYRFLLEDGLDKSAALQSAQLALRRLTAAEALEWARRHNAPPRTIELLSRLQALHGAGEALYRHPYYWAPFVLLGG